MIIQALCILRSGRRNQHKGNREKAEPKVTINTNAKCHGQTLVGSTLE